MDDKSDNKVDNNKTIVDGHTPVPLVPLEVKDADKDSNEPKDNAESAPVTTNGENEEKPVSDKTNGAEKEEKKETDEKGGKSRNRSRSR